jgi:hypothetical protein
VFSGKAQGVSITVQLSQGLSAPVLQPNRPPAQDAPKFRSRRTSILHSHGSRDQTRNFMPLLSQAKPTRAESRANSEIHPCAIRPSYQCNSWFTTRRSRRTQHRALGGQPCRERGRSHQCHRFIGVRLCGRGHQRTFTSKSLGAVPPVNLAHTSLFSFSSLRWKSPKFSG